MVMYSANREQEYENWMKILVSSPNRTSLTLNGLKEATRYYIKILRRHADGSYDDPRHSGANVFEVITGASSRSHHQLMALSPVARKSDKKAGDDEWSTSSGREGA